MKKLIFHRFSLKFLLLLLLAAPQWVEAQTFIDTQAGDVVAGFRKTGSHAETYEMVAYLGNITNFLLLAPGTTTNIVNYQTQQLTNMCPDNFNYLQWSVFSSFYNDSITAGTWVYTNNTCWFTMPRTNPAIQTTPPQRSNVNLEPDLQGDMISVSDGADALQSQFVPGPTNINNNTLVLLEATTYDPPTTSDTLTTWIGDAANSAFGDFNPNRKNVLGFSVENNTSNFTAAVVSDFYQDVPTSTAGTGLFTDPNTGLTNGACYYVGYFTLNPNGSMTFTRASTTVAAPVAAFSGSSTNGFAPLTVTFSDASTGSISNWLWNLGDGTLVTNGTSASVMHTYSTVGTFNVSLTVTGPGGPNALSKTSYVTTYTTPKVSSVSLLNSTNLIFSGNNCPAGVQYRFLTATNVNIPLASWKPVYTNTFTGTGTFSYTNVTTNAANFFRMVSP